MLLLLRRRRPCREWVRFLLRSRETLGEYHHLVRDMRLDNGQYFFQYFRMTRQRFDHLLSSVGPRLQKRTTFWRKPISPTESSLVTFRYLAHGSTRRYALKVSALDDGRQAALSVRHARPCARFWTRCTALPPTLPSGNGLLLASQDSGTSRTVSQPWTASTWPSNPHLMQAPTHIIIRASTVVCCWPVVMQATSLPFWTLGNQGGTATAAYSATMRWERASCPRQWASPTRALAGNQNKATVCVCG
ncbi:unnamed protein product [Ixodes hexagonus]